MRQLIAFFTLAYLISWLIWLPLYAPIFGINSLYVLPFNHAIGGLGPLLASIITTFIFSGKAGLLDLVKKSFQFKPILFFLIALFSPFVLLVVAALINYFVSKQAIDISTILHSKEFPEMSLIVFFAYNLIFFGWGEELGWRGFALPKIQKKMNALNSALVLTVFWALWHWPLFFYRPGYTTMDLAGIVGWLFSLLTGSVLLSYLFNSSRGSILICAIFHTTIDVAFTADFADKSIVNYLGFLITMWGIITIVFFKPKNLSKSERIVD